MQKYSVLLAWWVYLSLLYLQAVDHHRLRYVNYSLDIFCFTLQSVILFIVWYKQLCHWRYGARRHKYSYFSCCVFFVADAVQSSLILRFCIYMVTIIMYFIILILLLVGE